MEFRLCVEPKVRVRTKLRYTQYCVYTLVMCHFKENQSFMRKFIFILSFTFMISCSHTITTNYQVPAYSKSDNSCNPEILKAKNLFGLYVTYLGTIKLDESFTAINRKVCSESAAIEKLKSQACALNANLINITSEIKPGETIPPYQMSPCYRCIADFYAIDYNEQVKSILAESNRKTIKFEETQLISWKDFDIELAESSSVPYEFMSNIELVSGKMSIWTGAFKEFKAQGVFYCDISKVKKTFATEQNKKQIELLFSLTQIYAKRVEKFLNTKKPKIAHKDKIQEIIDGYFAKLAIEKADFNMETEYGNNKIALKKWEDKINNELKQFE